MKRYVNILVFVIVIIVSLSSHAKAQIKAPAVTSGSVQSVPIAVSKFHPENPAYANFALLIQMHNDRLVIFFTDGLRVTIGQINRHTCRQ